MDSYAYLGSIFMFAGNFAPSGWAFCDGSLLSIAENNDLFAILGTTYGGDGQTTFALPDLRGTVAVSSGQTPGRSVYSLGQTGGVNQVTLSIGQMPAHTHPINMPVTDAQPTVDTPGGNILAAQNVGFYAPATSADASYGGVSCANVGGNQSLNIDSPYLAVNYIICMEGIFPPHS